MRFTIIIAACLTSFAAAAPAKDLPLIYPSPDGSLVLRVIPTGRDAGTRHIEDNADSADNNSEYECRVEVRDKAGHKQGGQDFSSSDGDHGRGLAFGQWSPDSQFFVFSTVSSGGHHPWQYYAYAFSRRQRRFYLLDTLVCEVVRKKFVFTAPHTLTLKVYDRQADDSAGDFPAKDAVVDLTQALARKAATSQDTLRNPPMRSAYQ